MNYSQAFKYMTGLNKFGSVLGLNNIKALMALLDNPQDKINIIHVAGTNGKGSTITYMESILLTAGYKVGKYTSPVVFRYLEKYQINGMDISQEDYADIVTYVKSKVDILNDKGIYPTVFEVDTAIAYTYFEKQGVDIAIIETGMGGDTDATNVSFKALLSVITSISYDHTAFLGDTLKEIAMHKAGIIKDNCPCVASGLVSEVNEVIASKCETTKSPYVLAGTVKDGIYLSKSGVKYEGIITNMQGTYQYENIATAIEAIEMIDRTSYKIFVDKKTILQGIEKAFIAGRFEKICESPLMYIDGAHNVDAVIKLKSTIDTVLKDKQVCFIMGVLKDKDYNKECEIICSRASYIITVTPNNDRGLAADLLKDTVIKYNQNVCAASSFKEAIDKAKKYVDDGNASAIVIFGSLSYLNDIKENL